MPKLQQNGRHNGHAFNLAPYYVCDELVKLHGSEIHDLKIIMEEAKTPPRTLVNEWSRNVTNDQRSMHKHASHHQRRQIKITISIHRRTTSNSEH